MINVLFIWYDTTTRPQTRRKVWVKMPQVPSALDHVYVPLGTFNEDGEEDAPAMQVKRVYWVKDDNGPEPTNPVAWHAEVHMYSAGEYPWNHTP